MTPTITLNITPADFIDAQRLHWKSNRNQLAVIGSYVLTLVLALYCYQQSQMAIAFLWLVVPRAWLAAFWWILLPRRARRQYAEQSSLQQQKQLSWDTHSLTFRFQHQESKIAWTHIVKYRESRNLLLLYLSDSLYQILPKHCFHSEADLAAFRHHVSPLNISA